MALTWTGDGATKTAACHEGLVFASRLAVPAIIVIQNNQVALGTRLDQHGAGRVEDIPAAHGIAALTCDGNNVLDVYAATALARERCVRGDGPAAVVAETFRMGGHATHDEREARETFADELFEHWGRRDPVGLFEAYLMEEGVPAAALEEVEAEATAAIEGAAERALASRGNRPEPEHALYEGFSEGGVLHGLEGRLAGRAGPNRIHAMFDNLRRAFREAVDNFQRELDRDAVPETVDRLLRGMQREAVEAKAALEASKEQLARARERSGEEARNAEVCERREVLAREIGDTDTADVAATYAEKHATRSRVLADKARAIEAEIRLQETEYAEMLAQIRKARANRDKLAASAGRTRARESIGGTDDLFGELDRMAERIGDTEAAAGAEEALVDDARDFNEALGASRREEVADARLEELKRRMGKR